MQLTPTNTINGNSNKITPCYNKFNQINLDAKPAKSHCLYQPLLRNLLIVVLFFIGRVYIKNDMYFINPLINLLGFSFYDIEFETTSGKTKNARVFFKGRLNVDQNYLMQDMFYNFIFLKGEKEYYSSEE